MTKKYFILIFIYLILMNADLALAQKAAGQVRGIDFRMQFNSGSLDFTNISGIKRKFSGVGSELQTSLYLIESTRFRMSLFIGSRVMSWSGKDVQVGEYDDLQSFSVAPGLELHYGPLFIQGAYQNINANSYYISSASMGKQFEMKGPSIAYGLNFRKKHLGVGLSMTKMNITVPSDVIGLSSPSQYSEVSYSLNLIYYIGVTPWSFFKGL